MHTKHGRPKRNVFRFGLRSLFVVTLLSCLVVLAFKWRHDSVIEEKRQWLLGHSGGNAVLLEDGDVILVRNQQSCCAVVVKSQQQEPEVLEYDWYCRTDGSGKLFVDDPAIDSGSSTIGRPTSEINMQVGPFDLQWSGGDDGFGWFYFPAEPNTEFHVMRARSLRDIDAMSDRWKFKSRKDKPKDSPLSQSLIELVEQDAK